MDVSNGDVVRATQVDPSTQQVIGSVEPGQLGDLPTVASLLAGLRCLPANAIAEAAFDADTGAPIRVSVDHVPRGVDDEECYTLTDVEAHS